MGRKKISIDVAEVARLSGLGLTQEELCANLGISVDTLERRSAENAEIADAIKRGKANAAETVSNKLYDLCKKGNLGAIIWFEKTRRGLSDRLNVTSDDLNDRIEQELARLADLRAVRVSESAQTGNVASGDSATADQKG